MSHCVYVPFSELLPAANPCSHLCRSVFFNSFDLQTQHAVTNYDPPMPRATTMLGIHVTYSVFSLPFPRPRLGPTNRPGPCHRHADKSKMSEGGNFRRFPPLFSLPVPHLENRQNRPNPPRQPRQQPFQEIPTCPTPLPSPGRRIISQNDTAYQGIRLSPLSRTSSGCHGCPLLASRNPETWLKNKIDETPHLSSSSGTAMASQARPTKTLLFLSL